MTTATNHFDVIVVGGGVIGLSLAWELSRHSAKVCLLDRGQFGQEASWAGAGMVPPGPATEYWPSATPLEQLAGLSQHIHERWHQELKDLTGIDNGYRKRGAVYLAFDDGEVDILRKKIARWQMLGISCDAVDARALADIEPALAEAATRCFAAYVIPDEAQIRNPWHARALVAACERAGVDLRPGVEACQFQSEGDRVVAVKTDPGVIRAEQFCLAAGCWSGKLAESLGLALPVRPIRGQIVLLNGPPGLLRRNACVGPRYLVARDDGRVLIGSTQEDVGFEKQTTTAAKADLLDFAASLAPAVARLPVERCWSGLRPATSDGLPYLGRVHHLQNAWLATGHFRAGLQLSTGTAVVMRSLLLGAAPPVDVSSLSLERN